MPDTCSEDVEFILAQVEAAAFDLLILHPPRDGFLDGDAADDVRVAPLNERGAGGVRGDVVLKTERAELVGQPSISADMFCHNAPC